MAVCPLTPTPAFSSPSRFPSYSEALKMCSHEPEMAGCYIPTPYRNLPYPGTGPPFAGAMLQR